MLTWQLTWRKQNSGAMWQRMRTPHVTKYVHVRACVSARVWARVCAHVCMNNEIAPFLGFSLSHYVHIPYILAHSLSFLSCGTMFLFLSYGTPSSLNRSLSSSSRHISTFTEWLKVRFHWKNRENLPLECWRWYSKWRNKKPLTQWSIGSFRSLFQVFRFYFKFLSLRVQKSLPNLFFDFSANIDPNRVIFYSVASSLSYLSKSIKIPNFSPQFIVWFDQISKNTSKIP